MRSTIIGISMVCKVFKVSYTVYCAVRYTISGKPLFDRFSSQPFIIAGSLPCFQIIQLTVLVLWESSKYRVLVLNCEIWALGLSLTAIGVKSDLKSILADTSKTLPFTNLSWVITKKGHWRWFTLMFCFAKIEYKLQRGIHRSLFCYG